MFPQFYIQGCVKGVLRRIVIVKSSIGYKTVFDYGGFDDTSSVHLLFSKFKEKFTIDYVSFCDMRVLQRQNVSQITYSYKEDHCLHRLNRFSPRVVDGKYYFDVVQVVVDVVGTEFYVAPCGKPASIVMKYKCRRRNTEKYDTIDVIESKLQKWMNKERSICRRSRLMYKPRLECVELNPGVS